MSYERPKLNLAVAHRETNTDIAVFAIFWSIRLETGRSAA